MNNEKYQKLVGSLLNIATKTRPDIAASVSILASKTSSPSQTDWTELKRVLKYLRGTSTFKLKLSRIENHEEKEKLMGYLDANYIFFLLNGGLGSWTCRKQTCVSLSSTEAEFVALSEACKEKNWLRGLLSSFDCKQSRYWNNFIRR